MRDDGPFFRNVNPLSETAAAAGGAREESLRADKDPRQARLGIVHTPPALARWAMARVDACLADELGRPRGLGTADVGLLDVSVGTGVWLAAALDVAGHRGHAPAAVLGFELEPGVCAQAEVLLEPEMKRAGWPLTLQCVNTLAQRSPWPRDVRVPVVVGNPPWATRSDSRDVEPTSGWLDDFRRGPDGAPLAERRLGVLSDDYVRFWRWAAEQARHHEAAVVCMATNASFLDGPVHRGMRARLLEWFDGAEVVDLGGNAMLARRRERDENVFGVRPSAAVTLLWRGARRHGVYYRRLWGGARQKLQALPDQPGARVSLDRPGAPWVPLAAGQAVRWPDHALPLDEAMPFHREGVQTNRDAFATASSRETLRERMRAYAEGASGPPVRGHFDPERARARLREALERDPTGTTWIVPLSYRPFEIRHVVAIAPVSHRPRPDLLRAALPDIPCLLTARKDRGGQRWSLFGASRGPADACFLSNRSSCRTRVFPARDAAGVDNLDLARVRDWLGRAATDHVGPEALIEYALGLLASARYRTRFDGLLRRDYPRLLPPADASAFAQVRAVGRALQNALYGPVPQASVSDPNCGVGHFTASALQQSRCPERAARLAAWNVALREADRLFGHGACV